MTKRPGGVAVGADVTRGGRFPPDVAAVRRVLVIRLGALGDVVRTRFAFPGLRRLYPGARIEWLVEDRAAAGLEAAAGLDDIVRVPRTNALRHPLATLSGLGTLVRELRRRRYDLVVDFHSILKSATLGWLSGAPVRVGYAAPLAREGSARFFTHPVAVSGDHLSRFRRNAALIEFLGGSVPDEPPPLADLGTPGPEVAALERGLVVMHPGTSESTRYKRWDPDRYAEVARRLHDVLGREVLVTWGPVDGERAAAERVVEQAGGAARLAPATRGISELLGLLGRGCLFVGSDSGPMHLASLAGLPVVALFGPTDPIENEPFPGIPSRIVRVDVGCNPCREGCPALTCMQAIPADRVVEAARSLVAPPSGLD